MHGTSWCILHGHMGVACNKWLGYSGMYRGERNPPSLFLCTARAVAEGDWSPSKPVTREWKGKRNTITPAASPFPSYKGLHVCNVYETHKPGRRCVIKARVWHCGWGHSIGTWLMQGQALYQARVYNWWCSHRNSKLHKPPTEAYTSVIVTSCQPAARSQDWQQINPWESAASEIKGWKITCDHSKVNLSGKRFLTGVALEYVYTTSPIHLHGKSTP